MTLETPAEFYTDGVSATDTEAELLKYLDSLMDRCRDVATLLNGTQSIRVAQQLAGYSKLRTVMNQTGLRIRSAGLQPGGIGRLTPDEVRDAKERNAQVLADELAQLRMIDTFTVQYSAGVLKSNEVAYWVKGAREVIGAAHNTILAWARLLAWERKFGQQGDDFEKNYRGALG
jgi:hypothetical protein